MPIVVPRGNEFISEPDVVPSSLNVRRVERIRTGRGTYVVLVEDMSLALLVITMVWLPYTIPAPLKRRAGEPIWPVPDLFT
jgi:hypothetical protein